jgi:Phage tail lysozyme
MATVIDALVVTLGLDATKFTQGQKDSSAALKKTKDEADRTAKEMQAGGKKAGEFFGGIKTQVVGLLGVFTAGVGIKSFIQSIVGTDAAVGRMAKNVGMATDEFSAWQSVAERSGGSAGGMAGSIRNLSQQVQQLAITGNSSIIPFLNAAHVNLQKFFDQSTPMSEKLLELSDAFKGMDAAKAQALGAGMGLDEGTINVLMKGRDAVRALLAEQEKIGHANEADAAAAIRLQSAWTSLSQASSDLGRKLLTEAAPFLEMMSNALLRLSEWAAKHRPMVEATFWGLAAAVTAFAAVLAAPVAGIAALAAAIGIAVTAIGILYDDWKTWIDGGESAFGGFWQFFADKWKSVSGIVLPIFASLKAVFVDFVNGVADALNLVYTLFFGTSGQIRTAWGALVGDLGKYFTDFVGLIEKLGPALLSAFKAAFASAFGWVTGRAKAVWDAITGKHSDSPAGEAAPDAAPSSGGGWFSRMAAHLGVGGSSAAAPPMTADQHASAAQDIAQLVGMGWTKEQATGIAANIQRESGGNGAATGDSGQAYGLAQWHPDRQAAFAKWSGHDIRQSTHAEQVAFINEEMRNGSERAAGLALSRSTSATDAAAIVSARYERPADAAGEAQRRAAIANSLVLAGGAAPDPSLATGAGAQVAANRGAGSNSTSTSSNEVNIGSVTVNTQATDAQGVAKGLKTAVHSQFAAQMNYGLG